MSGCTRATAADDRTSTKLSTALCWTLAELLGRSSDCRVVLSHEERIEDDGATEDQRLVYLSQAAKTEGLVVRTLAIVQRPADRRVLLLEVTRGR